MIHALFSNAVARRYNVERAVVVAPQDEVLGAS